MKIYGYYHDFDRTYFGVEHREMSIKVSVITPCLNSEKTIGNTIESVLGQTYENIEYIIIDGGSVDGTVSVIEQYMPQFQGKMRYISEKDSGIYDAMNKGILLASGDVIGIINSDDWYEQDAVQRIVQCFYKTDAEIVYGEKWVVNGEGQREYHTIHSAFPPHPSTFVKKEVYQRHGMFDSKYRIAADRELLLRFIAKGVQFWHIDEILANFRRTGISNLNRMECAKEAHKIDLQYLGACSDNILRREDIEEKYDREKFVYISRKLPEVIKNKFSSQFDITNGLVIFGAGVCGKELETVLRRCGVPVRFFVDNGEKKWGLELNGNKIFSPEILRYGRIHVIVTASRFRKVICRQLQNYSNQDLTWEVLEDVRKDVVSQWDKLFAEVNL